MLCQGIGFGTLSAEIANEFLASKKLIILNGGKVMEDRIALAWYPRKAMPKYIEDIIRVIK